MLIISVHPYEDYWFSRAESRTTSQRKEAVCRRHLEHITMSKESKEFISPQALIAPGPAG